MGIWVRTVLLLGLLALAAPAVATAATVPVAPPEPGAAYASAAAAGTRDDGCVSRNTIAFRETPFALFRVRHFGRIECGVPVNIRCRASLFEGLGTTAEQISVISSTGRDRCSMASSFSDSRMYREGTPFSEFFRYRLELRRKRHRWAGTTEFCPKRSRNRRVLICKDRHMTAAPRNDTVTHR